MGSKHNNLEEAFLEWIFQNDVSAWTGYGIQLGSGAATPAASGTAGSLYVALAWSGAGTEDLDLSNIECSTTNGGVYTNYARIAVARSTAGWTISQSDPVWQAVNAAQVQFAAGTTADSGDIARVAFCAGSTVETNDILFWGSLSANVTIANGVQPTFAAGAITISEA